MIYMKRYVVLAGDVYYPNGWADYRINTDIFEEALAYAEGFCTGNSLSWAEIIDLANMTIVVTIDTHNDKVEIRRNA